MFGRCDEEVTVSYRPWVEALDPLAGVLDDELLSTLRTEHLAELWRLLPQLAGRLDKPVSESTVDPDARHALLADAIAALLRVAGPVIVVLDDADWSDLRSLQIVRSLCAADLPKTAIIVTYRETDIDRYHPLSAVLADLRRVEQVRRVTLDGLDGPAVLEFLEQSAGHAAADDGTALAQTVFLRTSGNPLYVGELLRHFAENGAFPSSSGEFVTEPDPKQLPRGLQEVIAYRVTRLGAETIRMLEVAAALGTIFDIDVVDEVLQRRREPHNEDAIAQLESAQAAGIVTPLDHDFQFRHAVIRDVLLSDVSEARRRRLHRDIAAVLEHRWALTIDRHLDVIAYHHSEGRTPRASLWCQRASQAAAAALDISALVFADRGLELLTVAEPPDPELQCDLLISPRRRPSADRGGDHRGRTPRVGGREGCQRPRTHCGRAC